MPTIVVYRQPACAACGHVERFLHEQGVAFIAKDIDADPAAFEEFQVLGYLTTPVTVVDGTPVPGFDRKRLTRLLFPGSKATRDRR